MSDLSDSPCFKEIPRHLAIIMDGNGRWAKHQGKSIPVGHRAGVEAVRTVLRLVKGYGVEIVTLFAFSSENWRRPQVEVRGLMSLFSTYLKNESKALQDDGIKLTVVGNRDRFSKRLNNLIDDVEGMTMIMNFRGAIVLMSRGLYRFPQTRL